MNEPNLSLVSSQQPVSAGSGGDDGTNYRLQALEEYVRGIRNELRSQDERLRQLEIAMGKITERLQHMPTKAGILAGVLSGMGVASGIGVAAARLFSGG